MAILEAGTFAAFAKAAGIDAAASMAVSSIGEALRNGGKEVPGALKDALKKLADQKSQEHIELWKDAARLCLALDEIYAEDLATGLQPGFTDACKYETMQAHYKNVLLREDQFTTAVLKLMAENRLSNKGRYPNADDCRLFEMQKDKLRAIARYSVTQMENQIERLFEHWTEPAQRRARETYRWASGLVSAALKSRAVNRPIQRALVYSRRTRLDLESKL